MLIDTAGCEMHETVATDEISKGNEGEVDIVDNHTRALIQAGLSPHHIAIITPYNLQVRKNPYIAQHFAIVHREKCRKNFFNLWTNLLSPR